MSSASPLAEIAGRVVRDCLGLAKQDQFLIVTDFGTSPEIPMALFAQAQELDVDSTICVLRLRDRSGEEPSAPAAAAMQQASAILGCASKSIYHTEAKGAAERAGARGLFHSPRTVEAWTNGAMTADFRALRETAERLRDRLARANEVRVTSPGGTDLTMTVTGRQPKGWLTAICRNPGEVSALPGGEVSLPPLEGTSNGVVVVERVMTDIGAVQSPITWIVKDGLVVDISGGTEAKALERHIEGVENARNIGELGIGINPLARITDDIVESKKRLGTAHIAMGDSAGEYGGNVICDLHLDGLVPDVRIEFDGEVIVEAGRLNLG